MTYMKTKIIGACLLLIPAFQPLAEASVLSSAGIGLPTGEPGARFMGMGGLSIAQDGAQTGSTLNPASLHRIRLTQLSIQFVSDQGRFRDASGSIAASYVNFNGFSFAVPLGRGFGFGIALVPRTRMDYWSSFAGTVGEESFNKTVHGTGGLNTAELSIACDIRSVVGFGLTAQYFFGKISESWRILFDGSQFTNTVNLINTRNHGFGITGGIIAHPSRSLSLGCVYRPSVRIGTTTEIYGSPVIATAVTRDGNLDFPVLLGAGVQYTLTKGLSAGTEYSEESWNRLKVNGLNVPNLQKRVRFSGGAEWMRGQLPTDGYFKRMSFRLGFYTERFYLSDLKGGSVREVMGTLGIGFPLITSASQVDVALGFGKRGNLGANGFSENCFRVNVSATIGEKWFERKY
jgi:hypothetical protein